MLTALEAKIITKEANKCDITDLVRYVDRKITTCAQAGKSVCLNPLTGLRTTISTAQMGALATHYIAHGFTWRVEDKVLTIAW